MSGPNYYLKVFLILINIVFLLVGLAVMGVGCYLRSSASLSHFSDLFAGMELFRSVPAISWMLIGCGGFIAVMVVSALVGICREKRKIIVFYLVILSITLILNVVVLILTPGTKAPMAAFIVKQLSDRLSEHYGAASGLSSDQVFTDTIDGIQTSEECCGWTGIGKGNIFIGSPWFQQQLNRTSNPQMYPDSCCVSDLPETKDDDEEAALKYELCVRSHNETAARSGHERVMHFDDCFDKLTVANGFVNRAVYGGVISAIAVQLIIVVCSLALIVQLKIAKAVSKAAALYSAP